MSLSGTAAERPGLAGDAGSGQSRAMPGDAKQYETLIVNLDYAGRCAGSCPVCALSAEERASTRPFLNPLTVENAFREITTLGHTSCRDLVLGVGRGNMLDLGDGVVEQLNAIAASAAGAFSFDRGLIEIATSVMGRLPDQIARAERIVSGFREADHNLDARFVVVANAANESASYWQHICSFIDHMLGLRGGGDGDGDILLLNLSLGQLPDIPKLMEHVGKYGFPVNVTWAPSLDPAAANPDTYLALEDWLAEWYVALRSRGMDSSLVARTADAMTHTQSDMDSLQTQLEGHGNMLLFVDGQGQIHYGFSAVSADMDPVRFASGAVRQQQGQQKMVRSPGEELGNLMRWPACRSCPHVQACVVSGAYKSALLSIERLARDKRICPSGMRSVFACHDQVSASRSHLSG